MAGQYNLKSPGVKRILQEMKEMQKTESSEFVAEALSSDLFEWHFAIRGPADTEFEGGIYCGRIVLPAEYPFKPPAFIFLTPTGRFEVGTKICLSISQHHPEHWQPSWSIRLALTALIAFMPSKAEGALGSLDYTKEERRALAIKSRANPPKYGSPERQEVINRLHATLLEGAPPVPDLVRTLPNGSSLREGDKTGGMKAALDAARPSNEVSEDGRIVAANEKGKHPEREQNGASSIAEAEGRGGSGSAGSPTDEAAVTVSDEGPRGISAEIVEDASNGEAGIPNESPPGLNAMQNGLKTRQPGADTIDSKSSVGEGDSQGARRRPAPRHPPGTDALVASAVPTSKSPLRRSATLEDRVLTMLAVVLAICIAYLLIRKLVRNFL